MTHTQYIMAKIMYLEAKTEVHTTYELLPKYNNVCKSNKEVTRLLKVTGYSLGRVPHAE